MIKTVFSAHPITIWRGIKRYFFILIIPFIRAALQYLMRGKVDGLFVIETIAAGFVLTIAIFDWKSIKITVNDRYIAIKRGILIKKCARIELSVLSSISLKRDLFDLLFGSVSCSINTEAGKPQKSDFDIKMSVNDANMLYNLIYDTKNMQNIKFSALRIALLAATTSSAVTGMIIGVPVLNEVCKLVGIALSDVLINGIDVTTAKFNAFFPPIINFVTIIAIFAYTISFVTTFLKNANFRLKSGKGNIEVRSGLIVQKKIMFSKTRVNNICLEQTPLMHLINKYCMRASIGGYGDKKGEKAIIVPVASQNDLKGHLKTYFSQTNTNKKGIAPEQKPCNLRRFLYIPAIIAHVLILVGSVLIIMFPYLSRLVVFLTAIAIVVDLYYGGVCYHNYKNGGLCLEKQIIAFGSVRFTIRELYCAKEKVGVIKITETPADRRHDTCKVKITVRGEAADSVKVKNIDKNDVLLKIKSTFKE